MAEIHRRTAAVLDELPMKGLFAMIGFRQVTIGYNRAPRVAGKTKWNYRKLWNFSLEGITSFTTAPLRITTYLSLVTATIAFIHGLYIFGKALFIGDPVPGFPSLMLMLAFLGGVQPTVLGIIGKYLGRVFIETKKSSDLYRCISVKRQRFSFILPP